MKQLNAILLIILIAIAGTQTAFAQAKKSVAVLPSDVETGLLSKSEETALTDRMSAAALNVLPADSFSLLTQDEIMDRMGGIEGYGKQCSTDGCTLSLGKKAKANYAARANVGKLGGKLRVVVELYNVNEGAKLGMFEGEYDNFDDLRKGLGDNAPDVFRKIPGASRATSSAISTIPISGGITVGQINEGYKRDGKGARYIVTISIEPAQADLSINGEPGLCERMPCKLTLAEGSVPMRATYEQYETKDTVVSIRQNNQIINIKLKPNFGTLRILPAFSNGIGTGSPWKLILNNKSYSIFGSNAFETRLMPNKYKGKLTHECYEDIPFADIGVERDKFETFDMSKYAKLKFGGLDLSAERDGEPSVEPVYVNGKQVGETPFSGAVPLCSKIEVGSSREMVNVELMHKEDVSHTARLGSKPPAREYEPYYSSGNRTNSSGNRASASKNRTSANWTTERETHESDWNSLYLFGGGALMLMNTMDSLYAPTGGIISIGGEFYSKNASFFRFGLNAGIGFLGLDEDAIRKIRPDADSIEAGILLKAGASAKLYPVDFLYLQGGAGFVRTSYQFEGIDGKVKSEILAIEFPVGGGFVLADILYFEALYHIAPSRSAGYLSIGGGMKMDSKKLSK